METLRKGTLHENQNRIPDFLLHLSHQSPPIQIIHLPVVIQLAQLHLIHGTLSQPLTIEEVLLRKTIKISEKWSVTMIYDIIDASDL